ncbi:hypothetical protein GCM10022254_06210 [Actinomadura meridiana]|uniref:3-oxoacyl-ACP synthase n=1 Tax=Actinomadura meridiana TaxID=559626 RepID=A0ABP8BTD9_9ACTN
MKNLVVSSIESVHGDPRPISALTGADATGAASLADDIHFFRETSLAVWELAAAAAERTLGASRVRPDLVVYVSENDDDAAGTLPRLLARLALPFTDHLALAGHDCGNLPVALKVSDALLEAGHDRVLLVLADRARDGHRTMANGLSVFSDNATACLLAREPVADAASLAVDAVVTRTEIPLDAGGAGHDLLSSVQLVQEGAEGLLKETASTGADFAHVVLPNYRRTAQIFLMTALGMPPEKLLSGRVAELAHSFSADVLITLAERSGRGDIAAGERLLALVGGPYSWSALALQKL